MKPNVERKYAFVLELIQAVIGIIFIIIIVFVIKSL